jgi:hypothetical protein
MGNVQTHGTKIEVDPRIKISAPTTEDALDFIQKHTAGSTVLEIGCGSGIYAKLLRDRGVKVIATDSCRINKKGLLPSNISSRMAEFTNVKAINNMIEKNAVTAVKNHGQNTSTSLFLSFPLPADHNNSSAKYDEIALRDFKGNKFFLIAMYRGSLSNNTIINYDATNANDATGSSGFHNYLSEAWNVKAKLLLETGRMGPDSHCYLIYFERKTANKSNGNNGNNNINGNNRQCPLEKAKTYRVGSLDHGLDGNLWTVEERSDGVKYWKRYKET